MADLQSAKAIVLAANEAIDAADTDGVAGALAAHTASDYRWRGMHPFHELTGAQAVAESFWCPLRAAMGPLQRRPDMFLAGLNQLDDWCSTWVIEMGHLMGIWDEPWLGFAPTRKLAFLRYAEFHRVEDGAIAETACYIDILNLLAVADRISVPSVTGAEVLTPGPRTCAGLLHDSQPPEEGRATVE